MKISQKVLILVITIVTVAMIVLGFSVYIFTKSALQHSIGDNQLEIARQTMDKIDGLLFERLLDIQTVAEERLFEEFLTGTRNNLPDIVKRLINLSGVTGPWDALKLVDKKGVIVVCSNEQRIGEGVDEYPQDSLAYRQAFRGEVYYSDLFICKKTGKPAIIFAAPVRNNEERTLPVIGAIIGYFSWPVVLEILESVEIPLVYLYNKQGSVIGVNRDQHRKSILVENHKNEVAIQYALEGQSGSKILFSVYDGFNVLASYVPQLGYLDYRGKGWVLVLETPAGTIFAPAKSTAFKIVLLLIPLVLLVTGVSLFLVSKFITHPITVLTQEVKGINASNLTKRLQVKSKDEIGELATTFNEMTDKLEKAYTELKESEEKYRILVDTSVDAITIVNMDGKIMGWNRGAEKITGYKRKEVCGKPILSFYPETEIPKLKRLLGVLMEKGYVENAEVKILTKKKQPVDISLSLSLLKDSQGKPYANVGISKDITERKQMERVLRESEEKYRNLFEGSREIIVIATPDGKIVDVNPAGVELFGYSNKKDFMKINVRDLYFNPQDREKFKQAIAQRGFVKNYELVLKRKDGQKLIMLETTDAVRDTKGKIVSYQGIMRDVTEQKKLEEQLIQSQKMEAVGRLAGGIAHDFNNLLTSILGYADMVKIELPSIGSTPKYINQIKKAAEQAAALTQQLLSFSRKATINPKVLNLNIVIKKIKDMLQRLLGEDITLEFLPFKELGNVKADYNQIQQIIMNLAVNSREAMPKGGKLIIETKNVELHKEYVRKYPSVKPGRYVFLSMSDTGCGIDDEIFTYIFEPFFTTKDRGTGLGLSTVYGIIEQNEGHINVYSEVGKGTTVTVYLPRVDRPTEEIDLTLDSVELPRGDESVLVVEDEESVREFIVVVLSNCGYKVLIAKSGKEAFSLWNKHSGEIDLLLTDVVMPFMSGPQLADKLLTSKPELKVLYMSGYSDSSIYLNDVGDKDILFLQKPFTLIEIATKIREILDS